MTPRLGINAPDLSVLVGAWSLLVLLLSLAAAIVGVVWVVGRVRR